MGKYSIALCMIVKNEEEFLKRCLDSVKMLVNEIIIVDTGSTDSTIQIAEEFNARIYHFNWNGDFAAARNLSINEATSDYILVLDADEYLDEDFHLLLDNLESGKDYYILNIKNYLDSQIFNHQAIRFFRNNKGFIYKGKIHEHLNIDEFDGLTKEIANIWIHHTGYTSNLYQKKNKHGRNIKLLLEEVQNHPTGYNYFNLGNQYKANREFDKALSAYKEAFYLSKERVYLSYLLDQMGWCLFYLQRYEEGIELLLNSIENFPVYTNLYYTLGQLYESLGYLKDAENCYLKCLKLGEVDDQQTTEGVGSYLAHFNLMRVYDNSGDLPKSLEQSFISLRKHTKHLPTLIYFIKLLIKGNIPLDEMKKFIDSSYPIRNQENLNNLMVSLFTTRSSLLIQYIDSYNLVVEPIINIIALQYGLKEKEALNEWQTIVNVSYEIAEDIVALSFKMDTLVLLPIIHEHFTKNELESLENLIYKRKDIKLSTKVKDFITKVITKVGLLDDQETVRYLLNVVTKDNSIEHVELMKNLIDMGFKDIVTDMVNAYLNTNDISIEYLKILGDQYARNGLLSNALTVFDNLIKLEPNYSNYEKMYRVYKKSDNNRTMDLLEREIKIKFPLVKWI